MRYCLDTSAFIDAWERYYPLDVFPIVWDEMDRLMSEGVIVSPEEVYHEIKKKSDGVIEWAQKYKGLFIPLTAGIQKHLRKIMSDFAEGFVDPKRNRSGADPVVVAVALAHGYTVVTGERPGRKKGDTKIPDVCKHYGIRWCNIMVMFRELKMVFGSPRMG